ncbi:paired amphipathic helix repeat-containing domain protein [Trichinella nativa]|uniref:Paired amphipathic helix repeat-containing domain protein n=1 Tax=Trichinella nativa TaxID=6335 RepID=A0A1Y3E7M9_9BILA|nr:paired amphipathic helix repeat-containing domain protein [Trichinella nativa]
MERYGENHPAVSRSADTASSTHIPLYGSASAFAALPSRFHPPALQATQTNLIQTGMFASSPMAHGLDVLSPRIPFLANREIRFNFYQSHSSAMGGSITAGTPNLAPSAFLGSSHAQLGGPSHSSSVPTDAMGFLERVKEQYINKPDVYNEFLEIMKEFKEQRLDTAAVLKRVAVLFHGMPHLILGFNTFLPPGYRVDVHGDRAEEIILYTPSGHVLSFSESDLLTERRDPGTACLPCVSIKQHSILDQSNPVLGEFSFALNYVNKIKTRFSDRPEVYDAFLKVLKEYQKDNAALLRTNASLAEKSALDTRIFTEVSNLFAKDQDLLDEFVQFLPDASSMEVPHQPGVRMGPSLSPLSRNDDSPQLSMRRPPSTENPSSSSSNESLVDSSDMPRHERRSCQRRYNRTTRQKRSPSFRLESRVSKHDGQIQFESRLSHIGIGELKQICLWSQYAIRLWIVHLVLLDILSTDDLYSAFICVLKLYVDDYLTANAIVDVFQMNLPLSNKNELLTSWITEFFNSSDADSSTENAVAEIDEAARQRAETYLKLDFKTCRQEGPSYRVLPPESVPPRSSKRSQLSATANMINNVYKYSITAVEDILSHLCEMPEEAFNSFSLNDYSGKTIIWRALKNLYGSRTEEMLTYVNADPIATLPVILMRFKEKSIEARAQAQTCDLLYRRDCEKIYWRSLDHVGQQFKIADSKAIRTRALVTEIDSIYDAVDSEAESRGVRPTARPHIQLTLPDNHEILFDDAKDLLLYCMKKQSGLASATRRKIKCVLTITISTLLGLECEDPFLSDEESSSEDEDNEDEVINEEEVSEEGSDEDASKPLPTLHHIMPENHTIIMPQMWFVYFRLHHILCGRLAYFRKCAVDLVEKHDKIEWKCIFRTKKLQSFFSETPIYPDELYFMLLDLLKMLFNNEIDNGQFEENIREIFTIYAYKSYTLDKIILIMIRQMQLMVIDSQSIEALHLCEKWFEHAGDNLSLESRLKLDDGYYKEARELFENQTCYKISFNYNERTINFQLLEFYEDDDFVGYARKAMPFSPIVEAYFRVHPPDDLIDWKSAVEFFSYRRWASIRHMLKNRDQSLSELLNSKESYSEKFCIANNLSASDNVEVKKENMDENSVQSTSGEILVNNEPSSFLKLMPDAGGKHSITIENVCTENSDSWWSNIFFTVKPSFTLAERNKFNKGLYGVASELYCAHRTWLNLRGIEILSYSGDDPLDLIMNFPRSRRNHSRRLKGVLVMKETYSAVSPITKTVVHLPFPLPLWDAKSKEDMFPFKWSSEKEDDDFCSS